MVNTGMLTGRDSNGVSEFSWPVANKYLLDCYDVANAVTVQTAEGKIYPAMEKRYGSIILFHDILADGDTADNGYEYLEANFRAIIAFIAARRIGTLTISQLPV